MQYRKLKAHNIFDGYQFVGDSKVLVTKADGTVEAIVNEGDAGLGVEQYEGILCPGFINAHCHIELSHLKNSVPQHTGLVNFVLNILKYRAADAEVKQQAMQQAAHELYNSGTVAVGDICNTTDSIFIKKSSNLYWHNFIEVSGFLESTAQTRFKDAQEVYKAFNKLTTKNSIVPHAPYSVASALFSLINDAATNKILSIHNQETFVENEFLASKKGDFLRLYTTLGIDIALYIPSGKSSFQYWLPLVSKARQIISVHNSFISEADLTFATLQNNNTYLHYCLCPNANLFIENTLPPINMIMAHTSNIVIGTDSYASNTALNMYEEIKTIQKYCPNIPLPTILKWATINGAKALGIDAQYGSFETNKKCGIVQLHNGLAKRLL